MATRRATILGGVGSIAGSGITRVKYPRGTATPYTDSVSRTVDQKFGERISILDFGAVGDGTTDDSGAINDAIASAMTKGTGVELYAPGATYALANPVEFPSGCVPIRLTGDGLATVFKRTANMPSGQGMLDVQGCSDIEFQSFTIDGQVTSSVGVLYSTIGGNSMHSILTANTSVWIHELSKRIRFNGVTIQHTGGYAILIDSIAGLIEDVRIIDCLFQNNRPHLFGTSGGDLNYGSWSGGVFAAGDGAVSGEHKVLRDFLVQGCQFRRGTGNQLWSHLNGLAELHSNFRWLGNNFVDIGLDCMGVNGVSGGVIGENTVRRNGYICSDDTSASTPRYLTNAYSVGLDTAGLTIGVAYRGNSFTSSNGAAMDLDGYACGVVSGNVARVPTSAEPEYIEDQIGSTGPGGSGNVTYGCQVSNTNNDATAGSNITITGNMFINLSGGGIRCYATRNSHVDGNTIIHPDGALIQPIILGNIGSGAYQRSYGNVVSQNRIDYSPSAPVPVVFEDSSIASFSGTDSNWVYGNYITGNGNAYEFLKNGSTVSVTVSVQASQSVVSGVSQTEVERTGSGNSAITRWYSREGATRKLKLNLLHKLSNSTPTVIGGPLFNVNDDGTAGTGAVSTGTRTTLAFDDAMATSRSVMDGFMAITDSTFTYPNDSAADLLPDTWGLIRYNSTTKAFQVSTSVSGGHRVWANMVSSPGGSNTQIQYNSSGAFAGSSHLVWDNASQLLTVTASGAGSPGIACGTGYIQSDAGFYATTGTATGYNAFQAPGGGMYALAMHAANYTQLGSHSGAPTVLSGDSFNPGAIYWDTSAGNLKIYNGSSWGDLSAGVASLNTLSGALTLAGTANRITVSSASSTITLTTPQDIDTSAVVNFAGVVVPNNTGYFAGKDTGGSTRIMLSYAADNNVYLDNPKSSQDVYIRPASGRFLFIGRGSAEFVCPNGDLTATLGHGSYRWSSVISNEYKLGSTVIVDSSRNASFLSLTINGNSIVSSGGAIQSPVTGSSIAFQTSNTNFQVDGNGNISGAGSANLTGGYKVGGTAIVDSSRNAAFLSLAINGNAIVSSAGEIQSPVTGASIAFQTANTNFQVDGNGNISGAGSINMTGGSSAFKMGGTTIVDVSRNAFFTTVTVNNNSSYNAKDVGGTAQSIMTLGSDNNLYLDNPISSHDIFIRPAASRYIFMGRGSAEFVCPNGAGTADLGTSSYYWGDAFIHDTIWINRGGSWTVPYISVQSVVTGSRALGTVYQNNTGKPMFVQVTATSTGAGLIAAYSDAGNPPFTVVAEHQAIGAGSGVPWDQLSFWVLPGNYYYVAYASGGTTSVNLWVEWY